MISVEEANSRILGFVRPLPLVRASLAEAAGAFAGADVSSRIDLPPFDNSAMDGYAVRAQDLQGAGADHPVSLSCAARIPAGDSAATPVSSGQCARIFTGSPLPPGADAVVMQEDVSVEAGQVRFTEPAKPWENVRLQGEDIRNGAVLVRAGERLNPARLALLAAVGESEVLVHQRCRVALLATGNELREPGEPLGPGQIYESNRTLIAALLRPMGVQFQIFPLVRDTLQATVEALSQGLAEADVVISTGGVSVGELDFVKQAFERLGGSLDFWKVAMRPGKPFVFGRREEKLFFGLPGNPVSALVTFLLLARPAILKMQGASRLTLTAVPGVLAEPVGNRGDRRHFARVRWESGEVRLAGAQQSHLLGSLPQSNALLDLPPGAQHLAGDPVTVLLWDGV